MNDKDKKRVEAAAKTLGFRAKVKDYSKTEGHQLLNIINMEQTGEENRELAIQEIERRAAAKVKAKA